MGPNWNLTSNRDLKQKKNAVFSFLFLIFLGWLVGDFFFFFPSIWVFFHNHSQTIGLKGEGISLTPQSHFRPLHRHFDIRQAITAESSPLHIGSSRIGTGNLWFPSACRLSRVDLLYLCYLGLFWIRPHMCKKMSLKKTGFCN